MVRCVENFWTFFLKMLVDQRGEAGDVSAVNVVDDDPGDADDVISVDDPVDDPGDGPGDGPDGDPPDADGGSGDGPDGDALAALRAEYDEKITALQKDNNRLGYALRNATKKSATDDDANASSKFTDSQLLAMWEEHKDDPKVVMQIIKEMQAGAARGIKQDAEKSADIATKKAEMQRFMTAQFPESLDEGSEVHQQLQGAIGHLHLSEHPFGDFLAMAASQMMQMPQIIAKVKEDTKKELLSKNANELRKDAIKNNSPNKGGGPKKGGGLTLTKSQMETARSLFGDDKKRIAAYAKMLANKSGSSITVD
jgi:hypothetical protein